jgi:hypothetical protein
VELAQTTAHDYLHALGFSSKVSQVKTSGFTVDVDVLAKRMFESRVSDKIESNSILTTRCSPAHASCPELMGQFLLVSPSHPGPQKCGRHRAYRSRPVPFPQICPE